MEALAVSFCSLRAWPFLLNNREGSLGNKGVLVCSKKRLVRMDEDREEERRKKLVLIKVKSA